MEEQELKKVELKSSEWLRGVDNATLYNPQAEAQGKRCMCCLGILGRELGVDMGLVADQGRYDISKEAAEEARKHGLGWLIDMPPGRVFPESSKDAISAMEYNDEKNGGGITLTGEDRVQNLNLVANKHGIEFVFVDDEKEPPA